MLLNLFFLYSFLLQIDQNECLDRGFQVHKFKFDLQPGSLTVQVAGEHQPYIKHPEALR